MLTRFCRARRPSTYRVGSLLLTLVTAHQDLLETDQDVRDAGILVDNLVLMGTCRSVLR